MLRLIENHFPMLAKDPALMQELAASGKVAAYEQEDIILDIGMPIRMVPLLLEGTVKVEREDEQGNELFLYYLTAGETCAMSLTCCYTQGRSEIRVTAEEKTSVLMIPVRLMEEWMSRFGSWRSFVIQNYQNRFSELLNTIDSIAFLKMDERLWKYLNNKAETTRSRSLNITHQEIATKLNTSREVISRLLKQLERQGNIRLGRNTIEVLRPAASV